MSDQVRAQRVDAQGMLTIAGGSAGQRLSIVLLRGQDRLVDRAARRKVVHVRKGALVVVAVSDVDGRSQRGNGEKVELCRSQPPSSA